MESTWNGVVKIWTRTNLEISSFRQKNTDKILKIGFGELSIFFYIGISTKMTRFTGIWAGLPETRDLEPKTLPADLWKYEYI